MGNVQLFDPAVTLLSGQTYTTDSKTAEMDRAHKQGLIRVTELVEEKKIVSIPQEEEKPNLPDEETPSTESEPVVEKRPEETVKEPDKPKKAKSKKKKGAK